MLQPKHAFAHVKVTFFWDHIEDRKGDERQGRDSLQGLTLV